jgi:hypothetical protein
MVVADRVAAVAAMPVDEEFLAAAGEIRLHGLLAQQACVLDLLAAIGIGPAIQNTARPMLFLELRKVLGRR